MRWRTASEPTTEEPQGPNTQENVRFVLRKAFLTIKKIITFVSLI